MARPESPSLDFLDERLFPTFETEPENRFRSKEAPGPVVEVTQLLRSLVPITRTRRFRLAVVAAVFLLTIHTLIPRKHRTYVELAALSAPSLDSDIDWSRFAYVQYVTSTAHLCNSLMLFESLQRLGSQAERVMMIPNTFNTTDITSVNGRLAQKALSDFHVKLVPIQIQKKGTDNTWAQSYTKLLAFNQTQYHRILVLDSDATIMKSMDELFLVPPAPVAMPRAYWLKNGILGSEMMLIEPSAEAFANIERAIKKARHGQYDMEIVNKLYGSDALVLPHRPYTFMTGDFKGTNPTAWLSEGEEWSPQAILDEAKYIHFSDWPLEKPWVWSDEKDIAKVRPKCVTEPASDLHTECRAEFIWTWLYRDFAERRMAICGLGLEGSP
ncbi:glucose N-acetyltransferase [Phlyctema vagabunda]|uniref:Glucose N-acetyltransferase n=1 Tax=Phlyctema vagabunda TaxID=108571 RepID=A0ABR4PMD2_9HELO